MSVVIFAGCSKDDKGKGGENIDDTTDYIDSPLLPMSKMTWDMVRPEGGGSIKGYVFSDELSSFTEDYIEDFFVNEREKKAWCISYSTIYGQRPMCIYDIRHYYDPDDNKTNNFMSNLFNATIDKNLNVIDFYTSNTSFLIYRENDGENDYIKISIVPIYED